MAFLFGNEKSFNETQPPYLKVTRVFDKSEENRRNKLELVRGEDKRNVVFQ